MNCAVCGKELQGKDSCSAVNKETFEQNKDYWERVHGFGIHLVRVNPETGEPE